MKKSSGGNSKQGASFYQKVLNKLAKNKEAEKAWEEKAIENGRNFLANYQNIEWSSDLVPVVGRLDILLNPRKNMPARRISVPVQSCFLVTGFVADDGNYQVTWINSLC